jgi:putative phage-type endonuclease
MNDLLENPQGTPEWVRKRIGKVTASRMKDVCNRLKNGGFGAEYYGYVKELALERITDRACDHFVTRAMQDGIDREPAARATYELVTGREVTLSDFVQHPMLPFSGASPDGLVVDDGQIEIKCPTSLTHLDTLANEKMPDEHWPQVQWGMACTGRSWCDFVSYDPRFSAPGMQIYIQRVERDDTLIEKLREAVVEINDRADALVRFLSSRYS